MAYVDAFILPVPNGEWEDYKKHAELGATVWMDHGALSYVEAREDDVPEGKITSFPLAVKREQGDIIVCSFVTYKSRAHRDEVVKKVMEDPRMQPMMQSIPAYMKRMIYGGFDGFVER